MASKKPPPSTVPAPTAPAPAPTPITLDLRRHTLITLMPLDVRLRATTLTADAVALVSIESTGALETADAVASNMKATEAEILENMKAQLEPLEQALAAAKAAFGEVIKPLTAAREALAIRVVQAREALAYEGTTSCYVQIRDEVQVMDAKAIPLSATWTDKKGVVHEETLLVPDLAAIGRTLKGGAMVRGVYLGTKLVYGIRGAK